MLCELCGCEKAYNFHHLIPRTLHSNKWFKKRYEKADLNNGIEVCKQCHGTIHDFIPSEKEIGRKYYTVERLKDHPKMNNYLKWKRTKFRLPPLEEGIC